MTLHLALVPEELGKAIAAMHHIRRRLAAAVPDVAGRWHPEEPAVLLEWWLEMYAHTSNCFAYLAVTRWQSPTLKWLVLQDAEHALAEARYGLKQWAAQAEEPDGVRLALMRGLEERMRGCLMRLGSHAIMGVVECPACAGSGRFGKLPCHPCAGAGWVVNAGAPVGT